MKQLFFTSLYILFFAASTLAQLDRAESTQQTNPEIIPETIQIAGVGDIMFGTNFPSHKYLPPNDNAIRLIQPFDKILKQADVAFGNLEGAFLDQGDLEKNCKDTTKCYAYRMPNRYIHAIDTSGFDLISLANNHTFDFGDTAVYNTMYLLDAIGVAYAGALTHPDTIILRKGIRIGFIAFAPNKGCVDIVNIKDAKQRIRKLDRESDIIVVSFHGGAEGAQHNKITRKTEEYYGENRGNVYAFSHAMIDAGADIIFGHGPHIPRAMELYKNRLICYSLGNFCTYARFNLRGANGYAPLITAELTADGEFVSGQIHSAIQYGEGGVTPDSRNRAAQRIKELTERDFPEMDGILQITNTGYIIRK